MREIKFKAWDTTNKKWYTKVNVGTNCCNSVYDEEREEWLEFDEHCGVVVQYTGLKDENGKEIYEGDVFPPAARTNGEVTIVCYDSHRAKYKAVPLSMYQNNAGNGGWTGYDLSSLNESIGNIYEHPNLLGGGENGEEIKDMG